MSFLTIRQVTLAGERKTLINLSALAYIQEIIPDQDLGWQVGLEPTRALIFLHHKPEPIISLDNPDDLVRQVSVNTADDKQIPPKPSKKPK
ncbi:MAG: hypothetical protein R3B74_01175 [Nitrospirales bacterium]|nr:hypothetical protein [Nitrospirales bacterium]